MPGVGRRLAPEHAGRTRRRRPRPSRPAPRRGPSAGRRRWPSPSRARRSTRSESSASSTRLSKRKSLWITQLADVRGLVRVEPRGHGRPVAEVVGARPGASRSVQPPTCRATYPSPRSEPDSAGIGGHVDGVQVDEHVEGVARRASATSSGVASKRQARAAGWCPRASPSRRSREPITDSSRHSPTIVATYGKTGARACLDVVLAAHVVGALGLRPDGRAAQDQVAARGSAAGRSGWRRRRGTGAPPGCRSGRRRTPCACSRSHAATASTSKASSSRTGRRVVAGVHRAVARELVQLGGLRPHHRVVRRPVGLLERPGVAGRLVGHDQLVAAVHPLEHRRGDVVGA